MARRPSSRGSSSSTRRPAARGASRGRSGGGGGNNGVFIGLGAVAVLAIAAFAFMSGGGGGEDEDSGGPQKIVAAKKSEASTKSSDELWQKEGKAPTETASKTSKKWGSKWKDDFDKSDFRDSYAKVDRTIWNEVEELFAEARRLKVKALDARKAKNEDDFKKYMTQAVDTWRKGDLKSELFSEEVELLQEDMWDAMFKAEQKKLERLTKEFRGYIGYESK